MKKVNSNIDVYIHVEGGIVQGVYSNTDINVNVMDFDDEDAYAFDDHQLKEWKAECDSWKEFVKELKQVY